MTLPIPYRLLWEKGGGQFGLFLSHPTNLNAPSKKNISKIAKPFVALDFLCNQFTF